MAKDSIDVRIQKAVTEAVEAGDPPAEPAQLGHREGKEAPATLTPSRGSTEVAAGGRPQKGPEPTPKGYTGFLLIKCDRCGDVHAFCIKQPIREYRCAKCGGRTPLTDRYRLRILCECGGKYNYLTNIVTQQMDVNCFKCGTPVAVEWNERLQKYVSIGAQNGSYHHKKKNGRT